MSTHTSEVNGQTDSLQEIHEIWYEPMGPHEGGKACWKLAPQDQLVRRGVELLLAAGGVPYCDVRGEMHLRRPKQEGTRRTTMEFPVRSEWTAAWMARLMFDNQLPALGRKGQTQALSILAGMAIDNEEEIECADLLDRDLVFQALADLMQENAAGWSGTATELLEELRDVADRNGLASAGDRRWPKDGSHLTLQVRKLLPWLEELGVAYDFFRLRHNRVHRFRCAGGGKTAGAVRAASGKRRRRDDAATDEGLRSASPSVTPSRGVAPRSAAAPVAETVTAASGSVAGDLEARDGGDAADDEFFEAGAASRSTVTGAGLEGDSRPAFGTAVTETLVGGLRSAANPGTPSRGGTPTTTAAPMAETVTAASSCVAVDLGARDGGDAADGEFFEAGAAPRSTAAIVAGASLGGRVEFRGEPTVTKGVGSGLRSTATAAIPPIDFVPNDIVPVPVDH